MKDYNKFCKEKGCEYYIEWDYSFDSECPPYLCTSCKMVGQSYNIDVYPHDCVHLEDIQKVELEKDEKET